MKLMLVLVAMFSCVAVIVSHSLEVTLTASVTQAAFDVALAFALALAFNAVRVLWNRRSWARERASRDAEDAKKWRDEQEQRWERSVTRKRRRRRA